MSEERRIRVVLSFETLEQIFPLPPEWDSWDASKQMTYRGKLALECANEVEVEYEADVVTIKPA
jgi:hypothetical protein